GLIRPSRHNLTPPGGTDLPGGLGFQSVNGSPARVAAKPRAPDSPMLIVCPNCATSYDVDVASLRPAGRRVRCVRCRTVWDAELPRAEKLVAAAEALAPAEAAVERVAAAPPPAPEAPAERFEVAASAETYRPADEP